jgi:hypothetical protein
MTYRFENCLRGGTQIFETSYFLDFLLLNKDHNTIITSITTKGKGRFHLENNKVIPF